MISEQGRRNLTKIEHDLYAFRDFLLAKPKMSRDQAEYKWHKEKQAPDKRTYNPDEPRIDFQGKSYEELQENK